ncbi:hypothetical protein BGZ52_006763, partial [Haplosporangium bisporale]
MASVNYFVRLSLFFGIAFISLTIITELVHAQSPFSPIPAGDSGSIFIEGKAFYIQGGAT